MNQDEENGQATLPPIPPEINDYLSLLIIEKKLDDMPAEFIAQMKFDMYVRLLDYLTLNATQAMSSDNQEAFADLAGAGASQEEVQKFIQENCDYKTVMKETLDEFRETFLKK